MPIAWASNGRACNPKPCGPLNQTELARYIDQLDRLNAAGITPMVVLHHFSNPPWINAIGGWTNAATIPAFVDFVTKLVAALRDQVRLWNTFNEPDTYACCGYLIGEFPPLQKWRLDSFRASSATWPRRTSRCAASSAKPAARWARSKSAFPRTGLISSLTDKLRRGTR